MQPGQVSAAVAIFGMSAVYASGVRANWAQAGIGRGVRAWQAWCFALGVVVLIAALVSPIDTLADDMFSAHMAQHVLLAVVAPPLLVAGAPLLAAMWVLSPDARRTVVRFVRRHRMTVNAWHAATALPIAWAVHAVILWSWHLPRLYLLALAHESVHAIEHASFVGTGCLMWWGILHPRGRSRRAGYGGGIIVLFLTMMQTGALGAMITLSRHVWYQSQTTSMTRAWGLTPLGDQQLAGLIMWVPGGLLYLIAMSVLFLAWLESAKQRRLVGATALVALALTGCARAEGRMVPGGSAPRGRQTIAAMGCGSCHVVAGVSVARGLVGPPLTGIASRAIIAGRLANTPENMERWIMDPPAIDSNTAMPNLSVSAQSARDIVAYLYTLR